MSEQPAARVHGVRYEFYAQLHDMRREGLQEWRRRIQAAIAHDIEVSQAVEATKGGRIRPEERDSHE